MGIAFAIFALALLLGAIVVARIGKLSRNTGLRVIASAIIVVPVVLLITLAIGEMVGGDISGAQHVIVAIPLLLVLASAWRYPRVTAIVLVTFGLIMLLAFGLPAATGEIRRSEIWVFILMVLGFVVGPIAAGWLLWRASASLGGSSPAGPDHGEDAPGIRAAV